MQKSCMSCKGGRQESQGRAVSHARLAVWEQTFESETSQGGKSGQATLRWSTRRDLGGKQIDLSGDDDERHVLPRSRMQTTRGKATEAQERTWRKSIVGYDHSQELRKDRAAIREKTKENEEAK